MIPVAKRWKNPCTWVVAFTILTASTASAADIQVTAAGSLKDALSAVFADFTKLYGDGFATAWGSFARAFAERRGIADVIVADLFDDRLHLFVLACAAAKEHQLLLNVQIRLCCKRGNILGLRNAVFAVAGGTELGLFLAGGEVTGGRRNGGDHR
jgi:hypothetical protein